LFSFTTKFVSNTKPTKGSHPPEMDPTIHTFRDAGIDIEAKQQMQLADLKTCLVGGNSNIFYFHPECNVWGNDPI